MEGASRADNISEVDFRKLADPAQIEEAHAAAARLAKTMRTRLTRRDLARRRGYRLDLRRTIHSNISHGGVPIDLKMRRRKQKPLRLVVLLDASGSMSMYTSVFLRFIHGVLDEFREAEAFLFHTRLAYVSDAMKEKDAARALDRLSMMAQGVGGGTRIGESLATFNRWHAARVIHSRTCVMIVSDGYETGDAALLGREMAALAKRCRRIVWLNPMMAWQGYAPEAAGIKAALPHVDLYAPANTLQEPDRARDPIWHARLVTEATDERSCGSDGPGGADESRRGGLRARHRGAHGVGDGCKSRRQGDHPARRHHRGGLDRRRLRPRRGAQGGAGFVERWRAAHGVGAAGESAGRARRKARREPRRRALCGKHVPEQGHHGHLCRAGAAASLAGGARREPGGAVAGNAGAAARLSRHRRGTRGRSGERCRCRPVDRRLCAGQAQPGPPFCRGLDARPRR